MYKGEDAREKESKKKTASLVGLKGPGNPSTGYIVARRLYAYKLLNLYFGIVSSSQVQFVSNCFTAILLRGLGYILDMRFITLTPRKD